MNGVVSSRVAIANEFGDRPGPYPMGLMGLLATVAMLFAAFTAAILVRRTGTDWTRVTLPSIVWANTVLLIGSTIAIELARASARRDAQQRLIHWLTTGSVIGVIFLVGQIAAWRSLAAQGVFLPSNPHAAFFYMLSAVHGLHMVGGLGALTWTSQRARRGVYTPHKHAGLTHAAIFWHFMGGVWIYLLVLLSTL